MPILVDSNVLVDAWDRQSPFHGWAVETLTSQSREDILAVNPVIWAELAFSFKDALSLDRQLAGDGLAFFDLPRGCLYLASQAFRRHVERRKEARQEKTPLPDFFIGAHAEWAGLDVVTRDAARFRTYFPTVRVIAPGPAA